MFTNNYIKLQRLAFTSDGYSNSMSSFIDVGGASFTGYAGLMCTLGLGSFMRLGKCASVTAMTETKSNDTAGAGVYFGSGTTPPMLGDYKLESPITSGLSITNPSNISIYKRGSKYVASATYVIRNTKSTDIQISEIGNFNAISEENESTLSSATKRHLMLLDRVVLSEPVIIPAGDAKVITYEIVFNQGETV